MCQWLGDGDKYRIGIRTGKVLCLVCLSDARIGCVSMAATWPAVPLCMAAVAVTGVTGWQWPAIQPVSRMA